MNQPEHIRKQASDPDRLMTLYYRSSGRPEMIRAEFTRNETARIETARIDGGGRLETEAPVSGQAFISDLRQINEAMRQFDGSTSQPGMHAQPPLTAQGMTQASFSTPPGATHAASASQTPSTPLQQPLASQNPLQNPQTNSLTNPPPYPQYPQAAQPQYQPYQNTPQAYVHPHQPMHSTQLLTGRTQSILAEVREKLNLSSDAEALNILVTLGHRSLKPLLG